LPNGKKTGKIKSKGNLTGENRGEGWHSGQYKEQGFSRVVGI